MRKPAWWAKDKRETRREKIKSFQTSRKAAARTNRRLLPPLDPAAPTVEQVRDAMRRAELEACHARTPRPNFSFAAGDVAVLYTTRQDEPGLWFRLKDGRIFSGTGEPDTTDPDDYGY